MNLESILDFPWVHVEAKLHDNFLPAPYQGDKAFLLLHDHQVLRQKIPSSSNDLDLSAGWR